MKTVQAILEKSRITYTVDAHILDAIKTKITNSKGKNKYLFSQNDILNAYYENELQRYEHFNEIFFTGVLKGQTQATTNEEISEIIMKAVVFLNSMQRGVIDFPVSYWSFVNVLLEFYNQANLNNHDAFMRAMFDDINVVFQSSGGNSVDDEYIRDDSIELYNAYFTNTLFRNYVVIFSEALIKRFPHPHIQAFVLDILSNNRKFNTLIKTNQTIRRRGQKEEKIRRLIFDEDEKSLAEAYKKNYEKFCQDKAEEEVNKWFDFIPYMNKIEELERKHLLMRTNDDEERKEIEKKEIILSLEQKKKWAIAILKQHYIDEKISMRLLDLIMLSLKKKITVRGASIFTNQLKTFFLKRQKFLKNKEMSGDTTFVEHADFLQNNVTESAEAGVENNTILFNTKKTSSFEELIRQIKSIIGTVEEDKSQDYKKTLGLNKEDLEDLQYSFVSNNKIIVDNIFNAMITSLGMTKGKMLDFMEYCIINHPEFFKTLYFYTANVIDKLLLSKPELFERNKDFFKSLNKFSLND